ncbi:MAG: hypothetical protein A2V70_15120 [Planctomycetes bacterium RBG_13_63_9]|nr:MAG: hypothetical protein A2V70_15120 [Planctomycetes bacterium RBG_13_63_9]
MSHPEIQITTVLSILFSENTYIAHLKNARDCVVVDPGLEPEKTIAHLLQHELTPAAILNTHGHSDHIGGNAALKQRWPDCPLVIGRDEAAKLTDPSGNLSAMFDAALVSPPADVTVVEGDTYSAAGLDLKVLAIPGHSIGHVVYLYEDHDPPLVFVGDVIFAGGIGRTDFPDGDFQQLMSGIRTKLLVLPDPTRLYPGHGPPTTVGEEKRTNPWVGLDL